MNLLQWSLYNRDWFEMSPKNRRLLVPLMIEFQRPICITTGLKEINLMTMVEMTKAGYSTGLVVAQLYHA